jgi:hypothetical protein
MNADDVMVEQVVHSKARESMTRERADGASRISSIEIEG